MPHTTPCSEDYDANGRDWTRSDLTRREAVEMARMCQRCPFKRQCAELAEEQAPHTEGIWGGMYWRPGIRKATSMDPLGIDYGNRKSVYRRVWWDRGKWRVNVGGVTYGYFTDEDEAGAVAMQVGGDNED